VKSLIEGASCEACNDFSYIFDVLSQHLPLPNTSKSKAANQSFFLPSFLVPWTGGKHPIRPSELYLVFFPMPPKSHLHVTEIILKDKMAMINYLLQRQKPDAWKALIVRMLQQIDAVSRRNTFTLYSCHCG
jgi:hypothetical protein